MELFNKLPFELQGMVLSYSIPLCDATPTQLEIFYSLPPDMQQKVFSDAFTSDDVREHYKSRCKPHSGGCVLGFSLYGLFLITGSAEEYEHYRQHGMCSTCKEKNDRRLARRKERLEGIARFNQAVENDDEDGIEAHMEWCAVDSNYDELSEYSPDEHEVMEMVNADNERRDREFYEDLAEPDVGDDLMDVDYDEMSDY